MSPFHADEQEGQRAGSATSLANSAGWSWNGPSANQAWAPFDCEPSGETTSTSRTVVAP